MGKEMKASKDNIKADDAIIFRVSEFKDGSMTEFNGNVLDVGADGVEVVYLSGWRTRYANIPYSDVIAKVDKDQPRIKLDNAPYSGHFLQFDSNQEGK
tara:strand:+ start:81 stop:374 length:294 start_codon:yes stop_codon:yes gene_type:complete